MGITLTNCLSQQQVTYSHLSIHDSDDWPDGDYEVEFNGQKELLTKRAIATARDGER